MILDADVCIRSGESLSEYSGRMAGMITVLRKKIKQYASGEATLEELLEEAKVELEILDEDAEMKEESPVTELLLDQLDELRHAISQHQMTVMAANAYDVTTMTEANQKLWAILK